MTGAVQAGPDPAALRAVLDSVFASPAYRWGEVAAPLRWWREWRGRLVDWLEGLRADNPAAFRLLVLALLIALVLVLAHAAWVVWRTVRNARPDGGDGGSTVPTSGVHDAAWQLREADRAAAEGRMADALQLAFVGLALTLERQGLLRYHPSKTPAECVREARLALEDRERMRGLVGALYVHAFGGGPFGADDYRRWRADLARPWHAPAG